MHRRILIAEQADTLRSVAETVLRQNGYEVISVSDAERAQEVLDLSKPDLMVIGADLQTPSRQPLYEKVQQDPRTSDLPLLLFEPADKSEVSFPEEVVIPRPFDPREFLSKVAVFVGQVDGAKKTDAAGNPLGASAVDDDFLDAALGLDQLDVTDSEVMDKTSSVKTVRSDPSSHKVVDYANGDVTDDEPSKVESLMINEDISQIRHQPPRQAGPPPGASQKLEILSDQDQYGMSGGGHEPREGEVHDYDWFVKSMSHEASAPSERQAGSEQPEPADSGAISINDPSAAVDPVTPPPASTSQRPARKKEARKGPESRSSSTSSSAKSSSCEPTTLSTMSSFPMPPPRRTSPVSPGMTRLSVSLPSEYACSPRNSPTVSAEKWPRCWSPASTPKNSRA